MSQATLNRAAVTIACDMGMLQQLSNLGVFTTGHYTQNRVNGCNGDITSTDNSSSFQGEDHPANWVSIQGLSVQTAIAPPNRRHPCTHLGYVACWARIEWSGKQNLQTPETARRTESVLKNQPFHHRQDMANSRSNPPTKRTILRSLIQRSVWPGRKMCQ
jgi:hypothetical protein